MAERIDVLVVGAGLSGIAAGYHLQSKCPTRSFAIVEARAAMGGTWDLFRYPGIRSDSDMYTLGYTFRPWPNAKAIADGPSIREYIRDTAQELGLDKKIRYDHRVVSASWRNQGARWIVDVQRKGGEVVRFEARFLFWCSGYYDYAGGYTPDFPGIERFRGRVIHPQQWTEDVDYTQKRVVVVGSGATAVTLVPELAKRAAHVTMLQRSPSYIMSRPSEDAFAGYTRGMPGNTGGDVMRWKNVALSAAWYAFCKRFPARAKKLLVEGVRKELGESFDVEKHFTPRYNPWDQRLCLVPDGDLFAAVRSEHVDVVTDHIETFTETGIQLASGQTLEADLVITATGLKLQMFGGARIDIDGTPLQTSATLNYKGAMLSDVPNLAAALGYTNASWTLKCELVCEYVCRLLNLMEARHVDRAVPRVRDASMERTPIIDFSSGYIQRALEIMPKQGPAAPWRLHQNYLLDLMALRRGRVDDGIIELSRV